MDNFEEIPFALTPEGERQAKAIMERLFSGPGPDDSAFVVIENGRRICEMCGEDLGPSSEDHD